jgi:hypothetical protein
MKSGYLYVLTHPAEPDLYKVGITTRHPEKRLAEHNSNFEEYTGQIVKETGKKWELKTYIAVPDPTWAEKVFWGKTPWADIPFRKGIEIAPMEWKWVKAGLDAVKKAGVRPPPEPLPDWVYAYTRWMRKRLEGRDITLVGRVKSMVSGNANFRCSNGHEWRTRCLDVAEGGGCPHCGIGERKPEEVWQAAKLGYICLLVRPDKPGFVRIGLTYDTLEKCEEKNVWEGWEVHRHRFVEEPALAEKLIWEMLGKPLPHDREPIKIELSVAGKALTALIHAMYREIALAETEKEDVEKN